MQDLWNRFNQWSVSSSIKSKNHQNILCNKKIILANRPWAGLVLHCIIHNVKNIGSLVAFTRCLYATYYIVFLCEISAIIKKKRFLIWLIFIECVKTHINYDLEETNTLSQTSYHLSQQILYIQETTERFFSEYECQ